MKTSTIPAPAPSWLYIDAEGHSIGRLSAKIAHVLRGKHRPTFSPHQACGDHVIILNAAKLAVTPEKMRRKTYYHHTGYPGSLQTRSLKKVMEKRPEEVLEKAIKGMLPHNRLRPIMLKRLHVFAGTEHPYAPQKPALLDISNL